MADSPYIVDVTRENFESVILHGSMQGPVLVDFWADWCEPCKTLMPILAKLADEYQGAFTLAKVDTEANQEIAAQLGIRSLPTVKLIINGAIADEFTGALPEGEVRAFLEKHIGAAAVPEGGAVETAQALAAQGQTEQALQQPLYRCGGEQILSSRHMGDALPGIINDNSQMIGPASVTSTQDNVTCPRNQHGRIDHNGPGFAIRSGPGFEKTRS